MPSTRICLVPHPTGVGGMVSFRQKLARGLEQRGIGLAQDLNDLPYASVLVIGGTRDLPGLWRARRRGIPVVQRLDGMNWLHRLGNPYRFGWRHYLRAESGNALLAFIRSRVASSLVYQSEFSRSWWEQKRGPTLVENMIIYNGVDLARFSPLGEGNPPDDRWRVLMVEGNLMGGYEQGLQVAVRLIEKLAELALAARKPGVPDLVELMVVGRIDESVRLQWETRLASSPVASHTHIHWGGLAPHEGIPSIDRSAHLLYASDINPACPNSVIEALACGLPILAFDTGALAELVSTRSGRVVPYGGDPWRLDPPDVDALAAAALEMLQDLESFRVAARRRAEAAFSLDQMVEAYLEILLKG